ncbi:DUF397 domain-containing protein [Streptomyces sp. CA-288835]|uniref:DUF397 domain-containing protein n=1 Tax=Streptomyces sp. CA-288835 TaxID=3240069 RepID=UPI003D9033EB
MGDRFQGDRRLPRAAACFRPGTSTDADGGGDNGQATELASEQAWFKSSHSDESQNCIEVAQFVPEDAGSSRPTATAQEPTASRSPASPPP